MAYCLQSSIHSLSSIPTLAAPEHVCTTLISRSSIFDRPRTSRGGTCWGSESSLVPAREKVLNNISNYENDIHALNMLGRLNGILTKTAF